MCFLRHTNSGINQKGSRWTKAFNGLLVLVHLTATLAVAVCEGRALAWQPAWEDLAGQPVDIAPWTYAWRADRVVQEKPEAYFIPRRLARIDGQCRLCAADVLHPDTHRAGGHAGVTQRLLYAGGQGGNVRRCTPG